jgi:ABC-type polysaccharide/polyol phosphate export permease
MIALGLVFAARFKSEELTGGLMNVVTIPMMLLSGVFFSLEEAPAPLQAFAGALPLTQVVGGARQIMLEGAGLTALLPNVVYLGGLTVALVVAAAVLFKWE